MRGVTAGALRDAGQARVRRRVGWRLVLILHSHGKLLAFIGLVSITGGALGVIRVLLVAET